MYEGDVSIVEEIAEQDFGNVVFGAGAADYSADIGNRGDWCTVTIECMLWCWSSNG
ncbi:hypothetical protein GCM10010129_07910 [Streptomyces fumigatiscleroticus]|nr:hypothetical protein GCM10010129_07910 [Streptomyces fumigatiscleroticus]